MTKLGAAVHMLKDAKDDVEASKKLPDYEAVEVLWVALVKLANLMPGGNEHKRMCILVDRIPIQCVGAIVRSQAVSGLLDLDPSLETHQSSSYERLNAIATAETLQSIKNLRDTNPREALLALGELLKRIRNKRSHGFKTRKGPRDAIILTAAREILLALCEAAVEASQ